MPKPEKKPHPDTKVATSLHKLAMTYQHWLTTGKQPETKMTRAELRRRVSLLSLAATLLRKV